MSRTSTKAAPKGTSGLLACVPANRRAEVAAALRDRPELQRHLEACRSGVVDCWTALRLLGLDPGQWNSPIRPTDAPEQCWDCNFYASTDAEGFWCWYDMKQKSRMQFACPITQYPLTRSEK